MNDEPIDDEAPLSGPTDAIKPWTIKSIASEARDRAIIAARQEGLTVGQWLERLIRAATGAGESRSLALLTSREPPASNADDLGQLGRLARDLTPPDRDSAVMREARAAVRERIRALRRAR